MSTLHQALKIPVPAQWFYEHYLYFFISSSEWARADALTGCAFLGHGLFGVVFQTSNLGYITREFMLFHKQIMTQNCQFWWLVWLDFTAETFKEDWARLGLRAWPVPILPAWFCHPKHQNCHPQASFYYTSSNSLELRLKELFA